MRARPVSDVVSLALAALAVGVVALWQAGRTDALALGFDLTQALTRGHWMAWTWAGVAFFAVIAALLLLMILWGAVAPEVPRRGMLGIETTPGDRLFVTLLGAAFLHLGWLGLFGAPLWGGLTLSLLWGAAVFRWA